MPVHNSGRNGMVLLPIMLSFNTLIFTQSIHTEWAESLNTMEIHDIIDIGAYLRIASRRSNATLKAQNLLLSLSNALSLLKKHIALRRIDPAKESPSPEYIQELSNLLSTAYNELYYYDRIYASARKNLEHHTVIADSDTIVRTAVAQKLLVHAGDLGRRLYNALSQRGSLWGSLFRSRVDLQQGIIALFKETLLKSYREFHERHEAINATLWQALITDEEVTLELWQTIENARIAEYEALLHALCTRFLTKHSCSNEDFLPSSSMTWNDTPSLGAIATEPL